jgi:hypothetical protein
LALHATPHAEGAAENSKSGTNACGALACGKARVRAQFESHTTFLMPVAAPARWQPVAHAGGSRRKEASQSVSQSVGASRPRMRTQGRLQRWQPAAPRSPVVAQWHSCSNVGPKNGRAPSRVHTSVNGLSRRDPERPSRGLEPVGKRKPAEPLPPSRPSEGHRTTSH